MSKYHPFGVKTHIDYLKSWFGVIILPFYHSFRPQKKPSAPWCPQVPPGASQDPLAPLTPGM